MTERVDRSGVARRSFLTRLSAVLGGVGTGLAVGSATASAQAARDGFAPARHTEDDWLDQVPGRHRVVFDTTAAQGFGEAIVFVNNFLTAAKTGYGLTDADSAVVLVARHSSTPFAYNDAMWAKYGAHLAVRTGLNDPKTHQPPTVNLFNTAAPDLPHRGITIDSLIARGVRLAVCQMATRFFAGQIAQATGGKEDAVFAELGANLVGQARFVAAGIVAVNRAQERGYTLTTVV